MTKLTINTYPTYNGNVHVNLNLQKNNIQDIVFMPDNFAPYRKVYISRLNKQEVRSTINAVIETHAGWWVVGDDPLVHLDNKYNGALLHDPKYIGVFAVIHSNALRVYGSVETKKGAMKIDGTFGVDQTLKVGFKNKKLHNKYKAFKLHTKTDQEGVLEDNWYILEYTKTRSLFARRGDMNKRTNLRIKHEAIALLQMDNKITVEVYGNTFNYDGRVLELETVLAKDHKAATELLVGLRQGQNERRTQNREENKAIDSVIEGTDDTRQTYVEKTVKTSQMAVLDGDKIIMKDVADLVNKAGHLMVNNRKGGYVVTGKERTFSAKALSAWVTVNSLGGEPTNVVKLS